MRARGVGEEDDPEWDAFREAYPKLTRRTVWREAHDRYWVRLTASERPLAVRGAQHYAKSADVLRAGECGAQVWLHERRWESWQEPEVALPSSDADNGPRRLTPAEYEAYARSSGQWHEEATA